MCRDFECEWLTDRALPPHFRPDRIGVLFMEDDELGEYRAVCAPSRALAWREPRVFAHLVAVAKTGRMVVAKAGLKAWRVFASGECGTDRLTGAHINGKLSRLAPTAAGRGASEKAMLRTAISRERRGVGQRAILADF